MSAGKLLEAQPGPVGREGAGGGERVWKRGFEKTGLGKKGAFKKEVLKKGGLGGGKGVSWEETKWRKGAVVSQWELVQTGNLC